MMEDESDSKKDAAALSHRELSIFPLDSVTHRGDTNREVTSRENNSSTSLQDTIGR